MDEYNKIIKPSLAKQKMMKLCSMQEKCRHDIFEKLIGFGLEEVDCNKILDELEKDKFIDDARYAAFFTKDKYRFNKWGRIKIQYALRLKGISSDNIYNAIDQIDEEEYLDILKTELHKKQKLTSFKSQWDLKSKLMRFAQSRGFESDLAMRIIDLLIKY